MSFGILMQQISVIFLEVLLGFIGVKIGLIGDSDSKFLSRLTMTFLVPCTMISCSSIEGGQEIVLQMFFCILIAFVLFVVSTLICQLIGKCLGYSPAKIAVLAGTAALPNCGFMGIPLASAIIGKEQGLFFVTAALTAYNFWFFTYVAGLFREDKKIDLKGLITPCNIATFALIFILALRIKLPAPVQTFCSSVGNCTTPIALIIVGAMLANSDLKALFVKPFFYLVTALKGIVFPVLFMIVLRVIGIDPLVSLGMSIIACCPAGSLAAVMAKQTGVEEELCSQAVAHSTLFMLITVPAILMLALKWFPL